MEKIAPRTQIPSLWGLRSTKLPGMEWTAKITRDLERLGLRDTEVARRVGVSPATVGRWQTGTVPEGPALLGLARVLGVPVEYLLDESMGEPPGPLVAPEEMSFLELARLIGLDEARRRLILADLSPSMPVRPTNGHDAPRPLNKPTYADQVRAGLIPDHPAESLPREHHEPAAPAKPKRKAR
jgi:transcriptional regulator with XRE-family HTH domain